MMAMSLEWNVMHKTWQKIWDKSKLVKGIYVVHVYIEKLWNIIALEWLLSSARNCKSMNVQNC